MFASFDDVEGIDLLRWEDQQKIRKYVEGGSANANADVSAISDSDCAIEISQTSRAGCKRCNEKIAKGMVNILSDVFYFEISFQFLGSLWFISFLGLYKGICL